jgi:hypothetical protein
LIEYHRTLTDCSDCQCSLKFDSNGMRRDAFDPPANRIFDPELDLRRQQRTMVEASPTSKDLLTDRLFAQLRSDSVSSVEPTPHQAENRIHPRQSLLGLTSLRQGPRLEESPMVFEVNK